MADKHAAPLDHTPLAGTAAPSAATRRWPGPLAPAPALGAADDRFYKTVRRQTAESARRQDARGEFELLRRCGGWPACPRRSS